MRHARRVMEARVIVYLIVIGLSRLVVLVLQWRIPVTVYLISVVTKSSTGTNLFSLHAFALQCTGIAILIISRHHAKLIK